MNLTGMIVDGCTRVAMAYYKQDQESIKFLRGFVRQYARTKRLPNYTVQKRAYSIETKCAPGPVFVFLAADRLQLNAWCKSAS